MTRGAAGILLCGLSIAAWSAPDVHLSNRAPFFEPLPSSAGYISHGAGYQLMVRAGGLSIWSGSGARPVELKFVHASRSARLEPLAPLPGVTHYLSGAASRIGVPNYARLAVRGLYVGVDAVFHDSNGQPEFDLAVAAGGDASRLALEFPAGAGAALTAEGDVRTAGGVTLRRPVAWQDGADGRMEVVVAWTRLSARTFGFRLGAYDHNRPLVIDPVVEAATYAGGTSYDQIRGVALDASNNVLVVGSTLSATFPTPSSAAKPSNSNAYLLRLSPDLKTVLSTTFLANASGASGVGVDGQGFLYVCGTAASSQFTATGGGYSSPARGTPDTFVVKLEKDASRIVYAAVIGPNTQPARLIVSKAGEVVVAGFTNSAAFPTTAGAFLTRAQGGFSDGWLTRLSATGSLLWSTYLGSPGRDDLHGLAFDSAGNIVVVGATDSAKFQVTTGAFQTTLQSTTNNSFGIVLTAYVLKLKANGSGLVWSTFLGGTGYEFAQSVALDASDNVYVTGASGSKDFPTTAGAPQPRGTGAQMIFISKLRPDGSRMVYSTLYGGSGEALDVGYDIAVDGNDVAYLTGQIGPSTVGGAPVSGGRAVAFEAEVGPLGQSIQGKALGKTASTGTALALAAVPAPTGAAPTSAVVDSTREVGVPVVYTRILSVGNTTGALAVPLTGFWTALLPGSEFGYAIRLSEAPPPKYAGTVTNRASFWADPGLTNEILSTYSIENTGGQAGKSMSLNYDFYGPSSSWTAPDPWKLAPVTKRFDVADTWFPKLGLTFDPPVSRSATLTNVRAGLAVGEKWEGTLTVPVDYPGIYTTRWSATTDFGKVPILRGFASSPGFLPMPCGDPLFQACARAVFGYPSGKLGVFSSFSGDSSFRSSLYDGTSFQTGASLTFDQGSLLTGMLRADAGDGVNSAFVLYGGNSLYPVFGGTSSLSQGIPLQLQGGIVTGTGWLTQDPGNLSFGALQLGENSTDPGSLNLYSYSFQMMPMTKDARLAADPALQIAPLLGADGAAVQYATGRMPSSLKTGDLNGDGASDAVVTNFLGATATIFWGQPGGLFSGTSEVGTGLFPTGSAIGDVNGDGIPDLVFTHAMPGVQVRLGDGQGGFGEPQALSVVSASISPVIGDFNGDGVADIAVALPYADHLVVFWGAGDGTFPTSSRIFVGQVPFLLTTVPSADGARMLIVATSAAGAGEDGVMIDGQAFLAGLAPGQ